MYSGGTPSFNEGDIFVTTIPLTNVADVKTGPKGDVVQDVVQGKDIENQIYTLISENCKITRKEIAKILGVSEKTIERHIKVMDSIEYVGKGYSGHWTIKE